MKERKKKGKYLPWLVSTVVMMLFMGTGLTVQAGTLYESPYVSFTPDGYAWTVKESLPYTDYSYKYNYPSHRPEYWYDEETRIHTGTVSSIRALEEGEHYYKYERQGEVPVGYWEVKHPTGACIHECEDANWHGIPDYGDNCGKAYYSGWFAHCADCGDPITLALTYMSKKAVSTITSIDVDLGYYYTCPSCTHIDNSTGPLAHVCEAISFNKYKVIYDKNDGGTDTAYGLMDASFHMYNNEAVYRGEQVTPITRLSKNVYRRNGHVFTGWNTKPDGNGTQFADCAEIFNLSVYDCNEDPERGTVTLYAQWVPAESTLKIDPAGGTYEGRTAVTSLIKRYGETYHADPGKVAAPLGFQVSFDTKGGSFLSPIRAKKTFVGWKLSEPLNGRFKDNVYAFLGADQSEDTLSATYEPGSIILPTPTKQGQSFGGWFADADCKNPVGFGGDKYTPKADVTLYAKWVELVLHSEENYSDNDRKGAVNLSWSQPDEQAKSYKLYESKDGVNFSLLYGAKETTNKNETERDFAYKGVQEVYTVPYSGFYELSAFGAQGGGSYGAYAGGKGGSTTAKMYLTAGEKLTVTVGGQNSYNGGGVGSAYGNGGGATTIVSNLKGTILIAGGGGGASETGNGGAGGLSTSLRTDNISAGASGYAGGGGGYVGGNAGEHIVHYHTPDCMHTHIGDSINGGPCYTYMNCGSTEFTEDKDHIKAYRCDRDGSGNTIYGVQCGGECKSYCSHLKKKGHCVWDITYICDKCDKEYSKNPGVCTAGGGYVLTCGKTDVAECGYIEGQVLSSKPAYGGSNYVNTACATYYENTPGVKTGNGSASVKAVAVGYMNTLSLNGVAAPDLAAPDKISEFMVAMKPDGADAIMLSFAAPKDNGTPYWYKAESYKEGTETRLCESNITTETLITGVRGYYYIINTASNQTVNASNAQNAGKPLTSTSIRVLLREGVQYLHLAAVDWAGNVAPTSHIKLDYDEVVKAVAWDMETNQIKVTDEINGNDYGTIYQKDDRTFYVRADGKGAFKLAYQSFLKGIPTKNYQIDYQIFDASIAGEKQQRYITRMPYSIPVSSEADLNVSEFVREMTGDSILQDAMNTGAYRKRGARDNYFYQAFTIPKSYHGKTIVVTPVAGATYEGNVVYSKWEKDVENAVSLIADGEGPVISGAELLENKDLILGNEEDVALNVVAYDALSGVGEFYLEVVNTDNYRSHIYYPEEDGHIKINLTQENTIFSGDMAITVYAADHVGNETKITYGITEFALTTEIERILTPHEPIFKCGESGILTITTWGYAERVEVEFPEEFIMLNPDLNQCYDYSSSPQYKQEEKLQFMIPLKVPPNQQYKITVRAYKGDRRLEDYPSFSTIAVEGSVLEEFRTRLR